MECLIGVYRILKHMDAELEKKLEEIGSWLGSGSINIFGLPFAGKDTHGKELSRFFDAPLIGGGDIIRNSQGNQEVKDTIAAGFLAPTDKYLALILPYLSQDMFAGHPLVLSSVGRWHGEEEAIEAGARESGHPIKCVLFLNVTLEEAHRRWQLAERGREDDTDHKILETRFSEFDKKTSPVIDYWRDKDLLIEIDSMQPELQVTRDIIEKIHAFADLS